MIPTNKKKEELGLQCWKYSQLIVRWMNWKEMKKVF